MARPCMPPIQRLTPRWRSSDFSPILRMRRTGRVAASSRRTSPTDRKNGGHGTRARAFAHPTKKLRRRGLLAVRLEPPVNQRDLRVDRRMDHALLLGDELHQLVGAFD